MMSQSAMKEFIIRTTGQANTLTIQRIYIDLLDGDLNAALLLSQLIYWSDKTKRTDGFMFKTYQEWKGEIGLSQYQVKRATGILQTLGIIETRLMRANSAPTVHYRVNFGILTNSIIKFLDNRETSQSDYEETSQSLTDITTDITNTDDEEARTQDSNFARAIKVYELNIGPITQAVSEDIKAYIDDTPIEWFEEAAKEAATNNKRSWGYMRKIIQRWKVEGFKYDSRTKQPARRNGGGDRAKEKFDADIAALQAWVAQGE